MIAHVVDQHQDGARLRRGTVEPVVVQGDVDALGALLSVGDEGGGPPPDQRDQGFERFWRGPGANGRPGSGRGLSIVAAVALRHRGRVSVEGPAFSIRLPAPEVSE